MTLDIMHDQDLSRSRTPSIMKATPQRPGPNGSRVVKKRSLPRLGDGLCDVFSITLNSPAQTEDISISSVDHETSSSVFTPSEEASTAMSSTPDSSTGTFNFDIGLDSDDSTKIPEYYISRTVSYEPSLTTPYTPSRVKPTLETRPQVSLQIGASPTSSPSPKLLRLSDIFESLGPLPNDSPPKTPEGQIANESLVACSSVHKIDAWYHNEKSPVRGADGSAGSSQYLDLFEASISRVKSPGEDEHVANQLRYMLQYSGLCSPNTLYPDIQPVPQSPLEIMREHFYAKLRRCTDVHHTGSPLEAETNVHIFVDMSNIFIGFCESYKLSKQIPLTRKISIPPFSFKTLALVMERARDVQKRVLAGSIYGVASNNPRASWPAYFLEAEQLNYKMNVFSRVRKRKISPNKTKGRGRTPTERPDEIGEISDDFTYEVRNGEQGVDENLHLNMMDSMWDNMSHPGTMVLATGDAAEAEFSGGFLQYAIRALEKGWKLELVTWKRPLSSAWTDPKFIKKYGNQFSIIFLDDFLEELQTGFLA
ncbi:uncharacterized protein F4812DRAFT_322956 [Daldinia caldariorum]|uniref:uncharacterized protein n=1 Tax=Daldinia caldariorum TaxID=326644 RepID=UPI0020076302|nr:uncharacterized protein F4812DRAFT_322956 [Daldinia caldariorum]KAI1469223.1 hypothetical protein F4812DRAFT_322956 [Daldinia caldariorum]